MVLTSDSAAWRPGCSGMRALHFPPAWLPRLHAAAPHSWPWARLRRPQPLHGHDGRSLPWTLPFPCPAQVIERLSQLVPPPPKHANAQQQAKSAAVSGGGDGGGDGSAHGAGAAAAGLAHAGSLAAGPPGGGIGVGGSNTSAAAGNKPLGRSSPAPGVGTYKGGREEKVLPQTEGQVRGVVGRESAGRA